MTCLILVIRSHIPDSCFTLFLLSPFRSFTHGISSSSSSSMKDKRPAGSSMPPPVPPRSLQQQHRSNIPSPHLPQMQPLDLSSGEENQAPASHSFRYILWWIHLVFMSGEIRIGQKRGGIKPPKNCHTLWHNLASDELRFWYFIHHFILH